MKKNLFLKAVLCASMGATQLSAFNLPMINRDNLEQWSDSEVSTSTTLAEIKAKIAAQLSIPAKRIMLLNSQNQQLTGDTIQATGLVNGDMLYFAVAPEQVSTTTSSQISVEINQVKEKEQDNKDVLPDTMVSAIIKNELATFKTYLANGASVEAKDSIFGETALITATVSNSPEIFTILLEKGANINAQNKNGETALMLATRYKIPKIKNLLLEKGARVNLQDKDGKTALIEALVKKDFNSITELIKHGADETITDKKGKSAIDYAKLKNVSKEFNEAILQARKLYIE